MTLKGNRQKHITMKTIRLFTLFALLLMTGRVTIKAQDNVPFLQEGNEWNSLSVGMIGWDIISYTNYVNWCSGDTIIDGVLYSKIMGTTDGNNPRLFTLLREEEGKVWNKELNIQTEVLLYDFSANVGDTLRIGNFDEELVLDSISIEQIGGVDRKKFWFGLEYDFLGEPYAVETWIEGIGSSFGLLCSGYWGITGGYYCALCFHQNGDLVWQNPEYDACTVTAVEETKDSEIVLYPNPAKEKVTIEGTEAAKVEVFNALGQLVNTVQGRNEIIFGGLPKGIYSLHITATNGKIYNTKLVIRR